MRIHFHRIGYARRWTPAAPATADALHLVHASGQAAIVQVADGWRSLWMPVAGELRIRAGVMQWTLAARDYLYWPDGGLQNASAGNSAFLVLCGPPAAWQAHVPGAGGPSASPRCLFPAHGPCRRDARRLLVRLARTLRPGDDGARTADHVAAALFDALWDLQAPIRSHLGQCRGRSEKHRQQNLLRLLHVRQLIENSTVPAGDLLQLGRLANCSPCHLTRSYREVFGESPAEYAARLRFTRALELVRGSELSIREITEALGYESESTFCRSFKKAYGATTTQARSARARRSG